MRIRRVLISLATLMLIVLPAGCGGGESEDSRAAKDLLQRSFKKNVKSLDLRLEFSAALKGTAQLERPIRLVVEGPVRSNGKRKLPDLDWKVAVEGGGRKLAGRLVTVPENVFIGYQGTTYEVGEDVISRFNRQRQDPKQNQSFRQLGVDPATWLKDGKVEENGGAVGGDPTRKVSGELDLEKTLKDFNKLFQNPSVKRQLPSGSTAPKISDDDIAQAKDAVENPTFEVNIGRNDGILRRLTSEIDFTVPEDKRKDANGLESGKLSFKLEQTNLGGDQRITPPTGARPLSELLSAVGFPFTAPVPQ